MRKKENPDILPYKQRVGGSNPSAPTKVQTIKATHTEWLFCFQAFGKLACSEMT